MPGLQGFDNLETCRRDYVINEMFFLYVEKVKMLEMTNLVVGLQHMML
jgi:hypothetical protein